MSGPALRIVIAFCFPNPPNNTPKASQRYHGPLLQKTNQKNNCLTRSGYQDISVPFPVPGAKANLPSAPLAIPRWGMPSKSHLEFGAVRDSVGLRTLLRVRWAQGLVPKPKADQPRAAPGQAKAQRLSQAPRAPVDTCSLHGISRTATYASPGCGMRDQWGMNGRKWVKDSNVIRCCGVPVECQVQS